jgi:hypothetical protein
MKAATMRTVGFRTHVVLTLLACAGVALALGMPWYGTAQPDAPDVTGSIEHAVAVLGRVVGDAGGATGRDALGTWAHALTGLTAFTALMTLLCLTEALQGVAREGLRLGAFATLAVVAWKLLDHPGEELRHGALVAAAAALVLTASALSVASAPVRRPKAPRFGHPGVYVPPPPPPRWEESAPPPP